MKKKSMDEIVPPKNKRSIRNIPIPEGRKRIVKEKIEESPQPSPVSVQSTPEPTPSEQEDVPVDFLGTPASSKPSIFNGNSIFKKKRILVGGSAILLITLIFTLLSIFTGATVKVHPKQAQASVNETVSAVDVSKNLEDAPLTYKIIKLSESKSQTIKATGEENVETKASGTIIVYNDYTEKSQPLVKRTRFETPDGLIYRIDKSVTIPGKDGNTPGSLEVEVFADETGDEYNIESTSFTIPGFEGQPQFDGFTAKTKTALSGGFSGVKKIVSEEDLSNAEKELKAEIFSSLSKQVEDQISDDFIVIINESLLTFSNLEQKDGNKDSEVEISIQGTLNALVISEQDFSNFLANEVLTIVNQSDVVKITNINELDIIFDEESISEELDRVSMVITGRADFVWETDNDKLRGELAGNHVKELKNIIEDFPSITRAEVSISPFWKRRFPENVDKISIEKILEITE